MRIRFPINHGSRLTSRIWGVFVLFLAIAALTACRGDSHLGEGTPTLTVASSSFRAGEFTKKLTCDGEQLSPELSWSDPPAGTQSFALIAADRDSRFGFSFTHWVVYDLPPAARELPEGVPKLAQLPDGSRQGQNDDDQIGYIGPCAKKNSAHHYAFMLYAVDSKLNLPPGATRKQVETALKGHVVAHGEIIAVNHR